MDWLRWHHGTVESGRWRAVARRCGQPVHAVVAVWALLSEAASRSRIRGTVDSWDDEAAGAALDMDAGTVQSIREAMQGRALEGMRLLSWDEEQVKREREDNSKDRVRAFRERQRQETPPKPKSRNVTPRNARKRPDREIEEIERENPPTGDKESPPEGGAAAPEFAKANQLLGWWIKRQRAKPSDAEVSRQSGAAKKVCDGHADPDIRLAIKGMEKLYPYCNGEPWDLFDLNRQFLKAVAAEMDPPTNGNGRKGTDGADWRSRKPDHSDADDPLFRGEW